MGDWIDRLSAELAGEPEVPPKDFYMRDEIAARKGRSESWVRDFISRGMKAGKIKRIVLRTRLKGGVIAKRPHYGPK